MKLIEDGILWPMKLNPVSLRKLLIFVFFAISPLWVYFELPVDLFNFLKVESIG